MGKDFPILSWKRIRYNGIETPYIISDKGIVMNDVTGEFMVTSKDKDNYPVVKLFIDGKPTTLKVHRLCCEAFNDNPFSFPEVDHIDRNHWNPDKTNLEFVTGEENHRRLYKSREIEKSHLCNYSSGDEHYSSKYTNFQILQVCLRLMRNDKISDIHKYTKVDVRSIYLIKSGKIWKNISCYFSFNNDGVITIEIIDLIKFMVSNGYSRNEIIASINIKRKEYFIDILNDIIDCIKKEK